MMTGGAGVGLGLDDRVIPAGAFLRTYTRISPSDFFIFKRERSLAKK